MATTATSPNEVVVVRRHGMTEDQLRVLRRFIGGTVGGVLQAACSHPFDTIKSRIQRGQYPNITACVKATWRNEGIRGFYRGVTPPLVLGGLYNSILFSLNQQMANLITPADHDKSKPLPLWRTAVAAQLTAPLYVLAITPCEKVKVQLQLQGKDGKVKIRGPIACVRNIIATEGYRGFLSGYIPTVLSRIIGLPFYFMGYQLTKDALMKTSLKDTTTGREMVAPMLGGVVAGILFWTSNYPCDYIKTQLQAGQGTVSGRQIIRDTYFSGGVRAFYKGFASCLLRAAPANAAVWLGIELTTKFMIKHDW